MIVTLVALYFIGGLIPHRIATRLIALGERIIEAVPLAGSIYSAIKQTVEAVKSGASDERFSSVTFVEYPRPDAWALGFVTKKTKIRGEPAVCIFVPTTPNPTSGMLIVVPEKDTVPSSMSVEEAIKFIISGGVATSEGDELSKLT